MATERPGMLNSWRKPLAAAAMALRSAGRISSLPGSPKAVRHRRSGEAATPRNTDRRVNWVILKGVPASRSAASSALHHEVRAVRARDLDPAAGRAIGAGHAPDGVVDADRSDAA